MKSVAAIFLASVIAMISGCAAAPRSAPASPVEADPWSDYHDGRDVSAAAKPEPQAQHEEAPKADAKSDNSDKSDKGEKTDKTEAKLADDGAPAPKAAKKKKGKAHRAGAVATKKPRKRTKPST